MPPHSKFLSIYEVSKGGNRGSEYWMKGTGLGGSSSINGMVYVRGHPADYNSWADEGCEGWAWNEVKAAFMEIEDHQLGPGGDRGIGGPLKVTVQPPCSDLAEAFMDAAVAAGTPKVADINAAYDGGIGYQPCTIFEGRRQSAVRAFLAPARNRQNLTVFTETRVQRILFEGRRAVGVQLVRAGESSELRARKEIILAAGAIESPKLLQLSGIGRASHLRSLGIAVTAEVNEVGENLQEHYNLQIRYRVASGSLNQQFAGLKLLLNVARYALLGSGPMTHAAHELGAFVRTRPHLDRPDAQLGIGLYTLTRTQAGLGVEDEPGMTIGGYITQPQSRGVLRITSADPGASPFIDANYLSAATDREGTIALVRYIRKITAQVPLRDFIVSELDPGPKVNTDDEILDACLAGGASAFHLASTCRMGSDSESVVDPQLRVRGVENLRIADTSIMPRVVSGNTNAAAMMIGWRASDFILGASDNQLT